MARVRKTTPIKRRFMFALASAWLRRHNGVMTDRCISFALCALTFLIFGASFQISAAPKPLRVLLITGGCCHDYRKQKDILKQGLEERASLTLDQIHTDDTSTHPPLAILGNPDYAKGFQLSKQVKNKHSKPRRG